MRETAIVALVMIAGSFLFFVAGHVFIRVVRRISARRERVRRQMWCAHNFEQLFVPDGAVYYGQGDYHYEWRCTRCGYRTAQNPEWSQMPDDRYTYRITHFQTPPVTVCPVKPAPSPYPNRLRRIKA